MQKNVIFLTKIIVYVKTLVKIFFSKFLLEAFIGKKAAVCTTFLYPAILIQSSTRILNSKFV